jgi:hypothetical protein
MSEDFVVAEGHPLRGRKCERCGVALKAGDLVTMLVGEPGRARRKAEGRPYNVPWLPIHRSCLTFYDWCADVWQAIHTDFGLDDAGCVPREDIAVWRDAWRAGRDAEDFADYYGRYIYLEPLDWFESMSGEPTHKVPFPASAFEPGEVAGPTLEEPEMPALKPQQEPVINAKPDPNALRRVVIPKADADAVGAHLRSLRAKDPVLAAAGDTLRVLAESSRPEIGLSLTNSAIRRAIDSYQHVEGGSTFSRHFEEAR